MNAYCVICSDRFVSTGGEWDIAAGICGHTFHSACLGTWLETSRTCPTCRKRWSKKDVAIKLYFDFDNLALETEETSTPRLLNELNSMHAKLAEFEQKNKQLEKDFQNVCDEKEALSLAHQNALAEVQVMMSSMKAKNKQIQYYQNCEQNWIDKDKERVELKNRVESFAQIKKLVQMTEAESKLLLEDVMNGPGAVERLVNLCTIIKREYEQCKRSRKSQRSELEKVLKQLASMRVTLDETKTQEKLLREHCKNSEKELTRCEAEIATLRKHLAKSEPKKRLLTSELNNEIIPESENFEEVPHSSTPPQSSSLSIELKTKKAAVVSNCISNDSQPNFFWKITSACQKKPKLTSKSSSNVIPIPSCNGSPQVPILQNIRRGYDGLGGHTSFTQSLGRTSILKRKQLDNNVSNTKHKMFSPRN
ncbi:E3 ubiquitin-protein ligase TRAIP [Octopus bimaculoides]|uniref:RING-type domain-containing protein n=1 Tax=Octopus bimaculoides TaxID=37653 RepID=A0A0L8GE18_OCTBM|nr:E3 ubiquitin-protein ligase TRAIP [Octopus bimaculoides]|eukprot:XP_014782126.1 PREDICTED: E3 ubiquitin-protein ligase TRAIP-like [Octopus bimaculoides]